MGQADVDVSIWLKSKPRFADLFNAIIFGKKQVILPDELEELPPVSSTSLRDKKGKSTNIKCYRDIIMKWQSNAVFVLLASELQDNIHYAMPVKTMLYDVLDYTEQIRSMWKSTKNDLIVAKENRINTSIISGAEFISRFRKNDRLIPIITLTFYYGEKEWDGALSLYDMFKFNSTEIENTILQKYIPDYHINLVDAGKIDNLECFQSDLQVILGMLKYRNNKNALQKYITEHSSYFSCIDTETYQAIRAFLHSEQLLKKYTHNNKEVQIDMCKALDDLYNDGITQGIKQGIEEGISRTKHETAHEMYNIGISVETIAAVLKENKLTISQWLS